MDMENIENVEVEQAPVEIPVEAPAGEPVSKKQSIAALVCGILGIVGGYIPVVQYFTFVLAILGIVFGSKAKKLAIENGEPTGMATAGLVTGIIGTVLGALGIVCTVCAGIIGMAAIGG